VNSLFGLSSDNFLLKISKVADILESYFSHFDIAKKRIPMLARFPLQASAHTTRLSRLGEWWPAAPADSDPVTALTTVWSQDRE